MTETASGEVVEGASAGAVEVDAVLPHPVEHVWKVLTTNDGAQALLGAGARLGGKGEPWRAEDGTHGVWRSYHPLEQVRVSWHADDHSPRAFVELNLVPDGDSTRVSLRHEPAGPDTDALRRRWSDALSRLDSLAT